MTKDWKQFEGQIVAGTFPLRRWMGGSTAGATFQTELGEVSPQPATIRLVCTGDNADLQLATWEMIAGLDHPHLLRVLHSGRCRLGGGEVLYIVTEYGEENLAEVLTARPLTIDEARQMLAPVVAALGHVHARGLVHGRVKPSNILARDDVVKLSVDSLMPAGEPRAAWVEPGPHDAPEAAAGEALTPAADVWSLGMTLVEALTQQLPKWTSATLDDAEPPLSLPPQFVDVARACLRREPQRRWTVAELAAWLGHAAPLPHPAQTALPQPAPAADAERERDSSPPPRDAPNRWRYMIPAAVIVLALAAVIAGPMLLDRSGENEPAMEGAVEQPATQPVGASPTASAPPPIAPAPAAKTPAGQTVSGEILRRVMPDVSKTALDTVRGAVQVTVRVSVDSAGRVTMATFETPGPSRYFADRSLDAARRWEFRAPRTAGQPAPSQWLLRFTFTQTGASASAAQDSP